MIFYFYFFCHHSAWTCLNHSISSLNFYESPKARKSVMWYLRCQASYYIYMMFEPSELTTATKVFIHFDMGFSAGKKMVQCINIKVFVFILQKKVLSRQIVNQIISNQTSLYFFLLTILVHQIRKSSNSCD